MFASFLSQTWTSTPIITRIISIFLFTITFLIHLKLIDPLSLTFSLFYIKNGEFWRLITPFCYFGKLNMDNLLHMIFFIRYSKMLEEGFIFTSDYLFLVLYNLILIIFLASLMRLSLLSTILSSSLTYIWTRKNRYTQVQLMGCLIFPAFYLPFLVPCFSFFSEMKVPIDDVIGILVGQSYYYFKHVTKRYGFSILETPIWLKRICFEKIVEPEKKKIKKGSLLEARRLTENNSNNLNENNKNNQNENVTENKSSNEVNDSLNDSLDDYSPIERGFDTTGELWDESGSFEALEHEEFSSGTFWSSDDV